MLTYTVRQFFLDGLKRYYLPLPKLTPEQLLLMSDHLRKNDFKVAPLLDGVLRAGMREMRLIVDQSGVAWANMDLLDVLVPCVPKLLQAKKVRMSVNQYFLIKRGGDTQVQFLPRLEARRTWKELRRISVCGLTPDERHMIRTLLEGSEGKVDVVTDFPVEGSKPFRVERTNYYRSALEVGEFAATLPIFGATGSRNSYLPINSLLVFRKFRAPSHQQMKRAFEELGEWCFLSL